MPPYVLEPIGMPSLASWPGPFMLCLRLVSPRTVTIPLTFSRELRASPSPAHRKLFYTQNAPVIPIKRHFQTKQQSGLVAKTNSNDDPAPTADRRLIFHAFCAYSSSTLPTLGSKRQGEQQRMAPDECAPSIRTPPDQHADIRSQPSSADISSSLPPIMPRI